MTGSLVDAAFTGQGIVLVAAESSAASQSSQITTLVAHDQIAVERIRTSGMWALAASEGRAIPHSSGFYVQVAWRTGAVEDLTQRAWSFTLDGHPFYVLTLGEEGTVVYDLLTGEWSQFQTEGLPGWNMELGLVWNGRIIAGDQQNPLLWRLEPQSALDDDFKPVRRIVTGGLPVRQRAFPRQFSLTLTASVGAPSAETPLVKLRISDDAGNTWRSLNDLTLTPDAFGQELAWRSMGSLRAPGRVYEITDIGGLVRIDGADADVEGFDQ